MGLGSPPILDYSQVFGYVIDATVRARILDR
jgi:hypothetical protein